MGTLAAIMMAICTLAALALMVAIKQFVTFQIRKRHGAEAAAKTEERARLGIVTVSVAMICGAVLFLGPHVVAPDMVASLN